MMLWSYPIQRCEVCWGKMIIGIFFFLTITAPATSQSTDRSLRVWVDTINLNVCEDKEFETWGVWVESFTEVDTVVGFRSQDTVLGCSLILLWDTSKIRLQPPYLLTPPQTLLGRFPEKKRNVDTAAGVLWLDFNADDKLRHVVGSNIPLFYLKGRIQAEDTVAGLNGGARVNTFELTGALGENAGRLGFTPGFVRVIRDTTPEYTGTLRTTIGELDTNRLDTISVIAGNLFENRVNEFQFSLLADTAAFFFADTVSEGTLAAANWDSREIYISDDSIYARFKSSSEILSQDSLVLRVVVERKTDSAFDSFVKIPEFGINIASCLGRLHASESAITGAAIPRKDTTITSIGLDDDPQEIVVVESGQLVLKLGATYIGSVLMYDVNGRIVEEWSEISKAKTLHLPLPELPGGVYYLILRSRDNEFWYKQLFIQTK